LLGGLSTAVWRFEGDKGYLAAFTPINATADEALKALSPIRISDSNVLVLPSEGKIMLLRDTEEGPPGIRDLARLRGFRAMLFVPLMNQAVPIGFVSVTRKEPGAFDPDDVQLLQTFADQAVIAIENARLFEEVQTRTRELAKTVEDLEIASQHKSHFVANMSHELRTPLAAILGYAELIQEGYYEPQGPKSLDALTRIRSNGKHLLGLINTVLDIAKIESGQFTLNMTEYAIESVVETVRSATESLAQNKKLSLKTDVAKSLPLGLGDEQRLTQVLLNLVGNAIKFTDTGEVRVTAKSVNGHLPSAWRTRGQESLSKSRPAYSISSTKSTVRSPKPRAAPALASPLRSRSSRCTADASGSNRRWARAQRSKWRFPRAPNFESAPYEQAHPYRGLGRPARCGADTGSVRSAWWVRFRGAKLMK